MQGCKDLGEALLAMVFETRHHELISDDEQIRQLLWTALSPRRDQKPSKMLRTKPEVNTLT